MWRHCLNSLFVYMFATGFEGYTIDLCKKQMKKLRFQLLQTFFCEIWPCSFYISALVEQQFVTCYIQICCSTTFSPAKPSLNTSRMCKRSWDFYLTHHTYASVHTLISCHSVCYLSCYIKPYLLFGREQQEIWWSGTFSFTMLVNISAWWTRTWRAYQPLLYWLWKVRTPPLCLILTN